MKRTKQIVAALALCAMTAFAATEEQSSAAASGETNPIVLTPPEPPQPRINGPSVFGVRPGSPLIYTIPATGDRPMEFSAEKLPAGLKVDSATGQISGALKTNGEYAVVLKAKNVRGSAEKKFRIVVGDKIALTPPMGWSSWNCWQGSIDQPKTLAAAKAMVSSGLIRHGWSYVNIDDKWQGLRGGPFNAIQGGKNFPDIQALSDAIHGMGLKFGLYSTPWITSYAGRPGGTSDNANGEWNPKEHAGKRVYGKFPYIGKYSFVKADVQQWVAWGVDYMKYDWNPIDVPETEEMSQALRTSGRDIVFSLSNSTPFSKAKRLSDLAECWRTTGDICDRWTRGSEKTFMSGVADIGFSMDRWAPYGGPGHWNDPDMMVLGWVGIRMPPHTTMHKTSLTPAEQYSHMTLWCLLSAPLLLGCDLDRLDAFTLGLLTNDEVLAVNQDALGRQAVRVATTDDVDFYKKELEDGSWAVGIFNRSDRSKTAAQTLDRLGITGKVHVRNLWRQTDLPDATQSISAQVESHDVVLLKLTPIQ